MKPIETLTLDDLESTRNVSRNTRDADRWTALEWLKLYAAYQACGWDLTPCQWQSWQVALALKGVVPQWSDAMKPIAPIVRVQDPKGDPLIVCPHCDQSEAHGGIVFLSAMPDRSECPHCENPVTVEVDHA